MSQNYQFPVYVRTIQTESNAKLLATALIERSAWFELTPLPDDAYRFAVKLENTRLVQSFRGKP